MPKLVNQFTKTFQLLGDEPYRGFSPGSHWGTSVPQILYLLPSPNPNTLETPLPRCVYKTQISIKMIVLNQTLVR